MDAFKSHLKKLINISDEESASVSAFFQVLEVKKRENLMSDGELCKFKYFVLSGCLRKFFVNEKGVEQTTEFAIENWWLADNFAFEQQAKSTFNIQAVEKTTLVMIDFHSQELLLQKHPVMERYFRIVYQRAYAASERRIRYLYEMTREELYVNFSTLYPWFIQRIPQYLIASFLGFTPEYLSEIRKKLRS
ncbi:cyclic nucleotide-binding protein [Chryseobacterium sp. Leaf180]|uniref:Crp/Fnr family transcriptional regulator n=1 Tax=Chryseobacterium sp. Leaf180 TaxID=1736289 RepID=UPI0006F938A7|nr:Crp/Fnr family transcriptional regulator [Chryseobacterium sp. Leaf180]KQR93250.1 cyclic nucleotide-binding protein [Chryseobacterium sp. Leaf180]